MKDKNKIPANVLQVFESKGLFEKDIIIFLKSDIDMDFHYADVYIGGFVGKKYCFFR